MRYHKSFEGRGGTDASFLCHPGLSLEFFMDGTQST